ncbi:MAG: hypothetical protein Q9163_001385 [Psora crenata]
MSVDALEDYIPVGSLVINRAAVNAWVPIDHRNIDLLSAECSLRPLLYANWARAFICAHACCAQTSVIRVYVLPDDVGRGHIERCDRVLQKHLLDLMGTLDVSLDAWEGRKAPDAPVQTYKLDSVDNESLFYLFNTVPSPDPEALSVACAISQDAINSLFEPEALTGLKTTLHPYQKRTAATMIRREVQPRRSLDPRLSPTKGPLGHSFYYDCQTGQVYRNKKEYEDVKGGVLAESMGLGKTLISLATILATRGHWPLIPPQHSVGLHPVRPATGSMMQMAAAAVNHQRVPWRKIFQGISRFGEDYETCLSILEENIASYEIPAPPRRRSRRPSVMPEPEKIRLCSATIIIVPQNLLSQWQAEIAQHFTQGTFKVLSIDSRDGVRMPEVSQLMAYDIILITRRRFEQELYPVGSTGMCFCPAYALCTCHASLEYESPLKRLHFLRVLMDEGHEFAGGRKNNAYYALAKLHVDRKWIVSGTPANGLLGVEVGSAAYGAPKRSDITNAQLLENRKHEAGFQQELKDLDSLRMMVTGFLGIRPWSNGNYDDPANWSRYITPYSDGRRKPSSLRNLLNSLVVRHRIEDVEADVQLPPLYNRIIPLKPSWHDKLTQNAFIITLISNAVTSERVDADYMFHPKNRPALHQLINNLRQSGFHWTGHKDEELRKTIEVSETYIAEHSGAGSSFPESDRLLLRQAITAGGIIRASHSWRVFSELQEMGIYVDNFPTECRDAWALVACKEGDPTLIGSTQLAKARKWVDSHLYEGPQLLCSLAAAGEATMAKTWRDLSRAQEVEALEKTSVDRLPGQSKPKVAKKKNTTALARRRLLTEHFTVSKARSAPGSRTIKDSSKVKIVGEAGPSSECQTPLKSALKTARPVVAFDTDSDLARSTLRGTASAKLSYLIDRVTALHTEEKILIFYEGDHIAYYIAQAMDLIEVRYLIYTRTLDLALKSAYIATFNSKQTFRVMLMNIHEAAHGLHIASASRVFFVNPVWQPNVEAQAIKRAHRIGQTRPVHVETLVLQGTLEDQMLQRRKMMTVQEHQRAEKSLLDDEPMSTIIKNARLLPLHVEDNLANQMAELKVPIKLFGRAGSSDVDPENPYADLVFPIETEKTKKLGIKKTTEAELNAMQSKSLTGEQNKRKCGESDVMEDDTKESGALKPPRPAKRRVGFAIGDEDVDSLSSPRLGLDFGNTQMRRICRELEGHIIG